jgi:hypothetical protein
LKENNFMKNSMKNWLRLMIAGTATASLAGVGLVACDGDDDTVPAQPTTTTPTTQPTTTTTAPPDGGPGPSDATTDATTDASDSGPKPVAPKAILVHGAISAGDVKLCLAFDQDGNGIADIDSESSTLIGAIPSKTPLFAGAGAVMPADLGSINVGSAIKAIAFPKSAFGKLGALPGDGGADAGSADGGGDAAAAPAPRCAEILSPAARTARGLVKNVDYFELPEIPKGALKVNQSHVLLITGCVPGLEGDATKLCGPGYNVMNGNLRVVNYTLDNTTNAGANNFVQVIHGSQEVDGRLMGAAVSPFVQITPGMAADGGMDASAGSAPIVLGGAAGVTFANTVGTGAVLKGDLMAALKGTSNVGVTVVGAPTPTTIAGPAQTWLAISAQNPVPAAGGGYVFIAVGDPGAPQINPLMGDFRGIHFLAFPTNPVAPPLTSL